MIYLILPAYNEERAIASVLKDIHDTFSRTGDSYTIVLVNDGSSDNTSEKARPFIRPGLDMLIEHGANLGMGRAMISGIRCVSKSLRDGDMVVSMDADTTHRPSELYRLLRKLDQGFDLVIASRYKRESHRVGIPLWRHLGSLGMRVLLQSMFPIDGIMDYTTNYRAYSSRAFNLLVESVGEDSRFSEGFGFIAEVLVLLRKDSVRIGEVPITLRYDLKPDVSKMRIGRTLLEYVYIFSRESGLLRQK